MRGRILEMTADLLATDPVTAARRLLGARLSGREVSAVILEVEAYGGPPDGPWPDPASHSYRGPRVRNTVMFGPAGPLYVYLSHGIHVCANVVTGYDGVPSAVLIRAAVVDGGADVARARRGGATSVGLARGPGNMCAALGITLGDNGIDLFDTASAVRLVLGDPPLTVASGPRVGVSTAADRPWRFWLPDHPEVSAYRRSPRAPAAGDSD
jgi:DNA-3-methyladenine glycosylase